ncbi:SusC/RagA family TonB-linked outer membrane protein [Cyclobacterium xiamenense]|uniref:SusC/RagA family TonB-linked outer membrane protein n=1 Tax=Cyclobacterium xiamenense TaxID=1297121 RepID=UPI0012B97850|nr:TonB-dependent receptor [Cyclobacterium xiamenense]
MKRSVLLLVTLMLAFPLIGWSQNKTVTGTVVSGEDNLTLPGVNVRVQGTNRGTVTDIDGGYSISVSNEETLVFSYIGFITQEVQVDNQSTIDITLMPDAKTLGEVVVVGYGSVTRGDLTGNVASLKGADIANVPVPTFQEAIQGRMSGVFVESSSGKVGEGVKIRVRGTSSISGGNEPLYVIDGIPVTSGGTIGKSNPMADINFNDIESFEVLKDASAAAIYGARGSNGVVLITTKSGTAGKTKFNVGIQRGVSSPTRRNEFLNSAQYIELMRESGYNNDLANGLDPLNNPADYEDSDLEFVETRLDRYAGHTDWRNGGVDTDWQEQAFNPDAGITNVNFSANGGNESTRFYFSTSYDKQDGIMIRNKFERISGRLNLDHKVSDRFSIGANFSFSRTETTTLPEDNQFNNPIQLVALAPITPIRDENGMLYDRPTTTYYNNLIDSENANWLTSTYRNINTIFGEYAFSDKLRFRSEFGVDIINQNDDRFFGSRTITGQGTNGEGSSRWARILNYNTNNYFTYTDTFAERHQFEAVGGMAFQKTEDDYTRVDGQEFPLDELRTLESAAEIVEGTSEFTHHSFLSYFSRINYKLDNKYLMTLSARYDASSRFGRNNQWGFYPAASLGWVVTEESFLTGKEGISLLKIRASYGLTGNADIGDFDHLGLFGPVSYGLQPGLQPTQIPNPNLTWETTAQFNVGVEFGLFNDRLTGELDYYDKQTSDLLLLVPVPGTTGFATQRQNIGKMQNYGFEVVLNSANYADQDFSWNTSLNFARNINRVRELSEGQNSIPPSSSRFLNGIFIGESIGVFYGPRYAGVDPANGDALYYTDEDLSETTNDYNEAARMVVGDPNPDFIAGITNNISYKNLQLSFLFQGVFGNDIYEGGAGFYAANGDWFDNSTAAQFDRWQNPGDITDIPQARLGECNGCNASSRFISDGSYVRLKTLSLGYNLPSTVLERMKISSARIYLMAQNLLTFTNYMGWDPEVNADYLGATTSDANVFQGNDFYTAPQAKTFSLGINVGF